ncbi:hypothetical protein D3C83_22280 [compost metagenome]
MHVVAQNVPRADLLGIGRVTGVAPDHGRGNAVAMRAERQVEAVVFAQLQFGDDDVRRRAEMFLGGTERRDDRRLVARVLQPHQQIVRQRQRV